MGQMTYALLYGIEEPADIDMVGEDGDGGLLGDWKRRCQPSMNKWLAGGKGRREWDAERIYIPRRNTGADDLFYGFFVAAGASGIRNVPMLESVAISDIKNMEPYAESYRSARSRWARFKNWTKGRGVTLPMARLYLVQTEVS